MPSKEDLKKELNELGVTFSPALTVLELQTLLQRAKGQTAKESAMTRKTDPMSGLQSMKWSTLAYAASRLGLVVTDQTRGSLMLMIREEVDSVLLKVYTIGKYKGTGATYDTVLEDHQYCKWAMEVKEPGHLALSKLQAMTMICYKGLLKDNMEEAQDFTKPTKKEGQKETTKSSGPPKEKSNLKTAERGKSPTMPRKTQQSSASSQPTPIQIHSDSEVESEISDFQPTQKRPSKKAEPASDSANSWMELGEKRKQQPGRTTKPAV